MLLLLLVALLRGTSQQYQIPANEIDALSDLYDSTNGSGWVYHQYNHSIDQMDDYYFNYGSDNSFLINKYDLESLFYGNPWNFTDCPTVNNPCNDTWQGVSCICDSSSTYCNIEKIFLYGNNMVGSLPPSIGTFGNLTVLSIGTNDLLTGPMPNQIGLLTKLLLLNISFTSITGQLEYDLFNITGIQDVFLYR